MNSKQKFNRSNQVSKSFLYWSMTLTIMHSQRIIFKSFYCFSISLTQKRFA